MWTVVHFISAVTCCEHKMRRGCLTFALDRGWGRAPLSQHSPSFPPFLSQQLLLLLLRSQSKKLQKLQFLEQQNETVIGTFPSWFVTMLSRYTGLLFLAMGRWGISFWRGPLKVSFRKESNDVLEYPLFKRNSVTVICFQYANI